MSQWLESLCWRLLHKIAVLPCSHYFLFFFLSRYPFFLCSADCHGDDSRAARGVALVSMVRPHFHLKGSFSFVCSLSTPRILFCQLDTYLYLNAPPEAVELLAFLLSSSSSLPLFLPSPLVFSLPILHPLFFSSHVFICLTPVTKGSDLLWAVQQRAPPLWGNREIFLSSSSVHCPYFILLVFLLKDYIIYTKRQTHSKRSPSAIAPSMSLCDPESLVYEVPPPPTLLLEDALLLRWHPWHTRRLCCSQGEHAQMSSEVIGFSLRVAVQRSYATHLHPRSRLLIPRFPRETFH